MALAADVTTPEATNTDWSLSNGTAIYSTSFLTAGYIISDNQIIYQGIKYGVILLTVSGLSSDATLSDINLSETTVTVSANALSTENTLTVTEGYSLALAEDVTTPEATPTSWGIESGTATFYAQGLSAGYVISGNQIIWQAETQGETLITVEGLSSDASVTDISLRGINVTVYKNALTSSDVTISEGYTLVLGSDAPAPAATATSWSVSRGTAIYRGSGTTSGYELSDNKILYLEPVEGDILITINGLSSEASVTDITFDGTTVTVSANALTTGNVSILGGYNLALASDVTAPSETSGGWTLEAGTAIYYAPGISEGYELSNNLIVYRAAARGDALITINGLSSEATVTDITLEGTTVTLSANALAQGTVTISSGYSLALAEDVTTPEATPTSWGIESGTAAFYAQGLSAGYVISGNQIIWQAATQGDALLTINGLSSDATLSDINLSETTVTVSANALAQGTVTISSGYSLALAEDVTTPENISAGWQVESGTAIYNTSGQSAGYVLSNNKILYKASTSNPSLITINGLSSEATASDITLANRNVTLSANALAQDTITITKGYNLKLANNVPLSTLVNEGWSISKGVATYTTAGQTEGYIKRL